MAHQHGLDKPRLWIDGLRLGDKIPDINLAIKAWLPDTDGGANCGMRLCNSQQYYQ